MKVFSVRNITCSLRRIERVIDPSEKLEKLNRFEGECAVHGVDLLPWANRRASIRACAACVMIVNRTT